MNFKWYTLQRLHFARDYLHSCRYSFFHYKYTFTDAGLPPLKKTDQRKPKFRSHSIYQGEMDFHRLSRRDLQALCKRNKIPANMTNVSMADSLKSLHNVSSLMCSFSKYFSLNQSLFFLVESYDCWTLSFGLDWSIGLFV